MFVIRRKHISTHENRVEYNNIDVAKFNMDIIILKLENDVYR